MEKFITGYLITLLLALTAFAGDEDVSEKVEQEQFLFASGRCSHGPTESFWSGPPKNRYSRRRRPPSSLIEFRTRPHSNSSSIFLGSKCENWSLSLLSRDDLDSAGRGPSPTGKRAIFGGVLERQLSSQSNAQDPGWEAMLRTLQTVAPSPKDRSLLRLFIKRNPTLLNLATSSGERHRGSNALPPGSEPAQPSFLTGTPIFSLLEKEPGAEPWLSRPRSTLEHLIEHFAEQLIKEETRSLEPIQHETQRYRINAMRGLPLDRDVLHESQLFFDGYLRRRGPRAVYSAVFSSGKKAAFVKDSYSSLLSIRDRYFNFSFSYGGYGAETLQEKTDESVTELADRNEERLVLPGETIEEELDRRRLPTEERLFNPFNVGRFSIRASAAGFGDWIELVWTTPNIQIQAALSKVRIRLGGSIGGIDFATCTTARWMGCRGRSGVELTRVVDENTRLRLVAGMNFGREDEPDRVLVDVITVTNDPCFAYLSLERTF